MLFKIENAFKIKNYYKDKLIDTPLDVDFPQRKINGLLVCHNGNINYAIELMVKNDFDETAFGISDNGEKDYQLYAYHWDGANVLYSELDPLLTRNKIEKIYTKDGAL